MKRASERPSLRLTYATEADRRREVGAAIRAESGNVLAASRRLGVSHSAIWRWIQADAELRRAVEEARNAKSPEP